jgi:hypothetical protein
MTVFHIFTASMSSYPKNELSSYTKRHITVGELSEKDRFKRLGTQSKYDMVQKPGN